MKMKKLASEHAKYQIRSQVEMIFLLVFLCIHLIHFSNIIFSGQMNSKELKNSPQAHQKIQEETNQTKKFEQSIFSINYTNKSQVIYQEGPNFIDDVEVKNYLCYQDGNKLHKVTEICYQDKIIRISDVFDVEVNPTKIDSNRHKEHKIRNNNDNFNRKSQKVRIFKKEFNKNGKFQKKDKKNIVKNLVKMFMSWLQSKVSNEIHIEALDKVRKLLNEENFNNRLIKKMTCDDGINKPFLEFLTEYAQMEVQNSRIQDKQSHYEAIQLYTELITNNGESRNNSENSQMQSYHKNSVFSEKSHNRSEPIPKNKANSTAQSNTMRLCDKKLT